MYVCLYDYKCKITSEIKYYLSSIIIIIMSSIPEKKAP